MKFKKGDQVRFLNETGGGIVNRVDDRGNVFVLTDDGFEIPVTEKDLVFSRSFAYAANEKEPETKKPVEKHDITVKQDKEKPAQMPSLPENIPAGKAVHLLLGFIPENDGPVFNSNIACYLINDSSYFLYYMAGKKESGSMIYLSSGYIEADTKSFIKTFDQTSLSKISDIHIQLMFISKGRYVRKEPLDKLMNLNLVNFSKESYYRENDYFEEKAVLYDLLGRPEAAADNLTIPEEIREVKIKADNTQKIQKKKEPEQDSLEVDLHYEELSIQNSQLSPGAILALQMSRFHAAIEEAISKNLHRLVIIHGLGQGTLKMQIRKELQEKYPEFIYQDASFKEYGFGATMVHLTFDQKQ